MAFMSDVFGGMIELPGGGHVDQPLNRKPTESDGSAADQNPVPTSPDHNQPEANVGE